MIRWIVGAAVYAGAFSVAAFGVVLAADRQLDVPMPYSVLLAPVLIPATAAALLLLRETLRRRRTIAPFGRSEKVERSALATSGRATSKRRSVRVAEGFVLLETVSASAATRAAA